MMLYIIQNVMFNKVFLRYEPKHEEEIKSLGWGEVGKIVNDFLEQRY